MNFSTGRPTWTWPDWRKAPKGTRVRHNRSGALGTYLGPSKNRDTTAKIRWDDVGFGVTERNIVSAAADLTPIRMKAWDLIGFDGRESDIYGLEGKIGSGVYEIRIVGGRARYEAVMVGDGSEAVRLARLNPDLRQINRYVDPDTELEFVEAIND